MAIRVIEVPLSVRFDPPPRPCLEDRREPTIPMKKRIGLLGMTEEERAELDRTKKWPTRQVEVPDGPPGFTLTSLPSPEYMRGYWTSLRTFSRRGPKSKLRGSTFGRQSNASMRQTTERRTRASCTSSAQHAALPDTASRQFSRALKALKTLLAAAISGCIFRPLR